MNRCDAVSQVLMDCPYTIKPMLVPGAAAFVAESRTKACGTEARLPGWRTAAWMFLAALTKWGQG